MENNKSNTEIVEELSENLYQMHESRMIDESILEQVEELMNMIYKEENKEYNIDNGLVDSNNPDYFPSTPPNSLFEYVENEAQFIEDYRNIINILVRSDCFISDNEAIIKQIVKLRTNI